MKTKASPRPWSVFDQQGTIEIHDATGNAVVFWQGFDRCEVPLAVHRANARLIVECVNAQTQTARVMKRELTEAERAALSVTRGVHITGVGQSARHKAPTPSATTVSPLITGPALMNKDTQHD